MRPFCFFDDGKLSSGSSVMRAVGIPFARHLMVALELHFEGSTNAFRVVNKRI